MRTCVSSCYFDQSIIMRYISELLYGMYQHAYGVHVYCKWGSMALGNSLKQMCVHSISILADISDVMIIYLNIYIVYSTLLPQIILRSTPLDTNLRVCCFQMGFTDFIMMTSSNGNFFRVTGPLCGEFAGHRWIPPNKGQWRGALTFPLIWAWLNGCVNNRKAGDLRRHRAHYDVTVVMTWQGTRAAAPSMVVGRHSNSYL